MNKFRVTKGVSLARLDFWAPGDMRDWVDRQACKEGMARSEFMRRMILQQMEAEEPGMNSSKPQENSLQPSA